MILLSTSVAGCEAEAVAETVPVAISVAHALIRITTSEFLDLVFSPKNSLLWLFRNGYKTFSLKISGNSEA